MANPSSDATPSSAGAVSPADLVDASAIDRPDEPALVFGDGVVTYETLRTLVGSRVATLRGVVTTGEVVPTPVRLDLPSIVELLALPTVGAVPMPFIEKSPDIGAVEAPGAIICVTTSGSEGRRRTVPLTMDNIVASIEASARRLGTSSADRWLLSLPIDHIGGLSVLYRSFAAGGTVVVAPFSGHEDLVRATKPTIASVVPTMLHRLLEGPPSVVEAIGTFLVGGGPLRPSLLERARVAGADVAATYGSTETASQVATTAPGEPVRHAGYVGAPLDGFEVGIDADDTIVVDGPAVFGGYLGEHRRTGPHRTSDLGRWEDDGGLTVLGRRDDVVISGGVNVSLMAVEFAIDALTDVTDVAVVAIDDDEWGSAVCALVVSELPRESVGERIGHILDGPQRPRHLQVIDRLPLLGNGKPDRAAIRAMFADR
jgi:O-succinylbenzoic acid--CoA ligase